EILLGPVGHERRPLVKRRNPAPYIKILRPFKTECALQVHLANVQPGVFFFWEFMKPPHRHHFLWYFESPEAQGRCSAQCTITGEYRKFLPGKYATASNSLLD